ncbi:MAG: glutamate 5-kinase, partial [Candidatus Omnitrophica bacterium]|nr:glutamate 5-kinase [Candidatus Omnitrophota bacterium]
IINENDAVSCEEIRFGDNDSLSARVAVLGRAEKLIMLSDVEGLLKGSQLVKEVVKINPEISSLAVKEDKTHTSGGMATKLEAAEMATSSGITTFIASGRRKGVICGIVKGQAIGTVFLPSSAKERDRKIWIANKKIKGRIIIDQGAKTALLDKGRSLLNVGIISVFGSFKKDDAVTVLDQEGKILGCGLVNYSFQELSSKIKTKLDQEVIHRDNFTKKTNR